MNISEQIRENRKKIGLTQEQIANYLGVSTPAVNKWENNMTYPDVTLLPALARLLKIDLNTLFSFCEELTELEVKVFTKELAEIAQNDNLEAAFKMVADKIREYPHCDSLLYSAANIMDACLTLSTMDKTQKEGYEKQILLWLERATNSQEETVKNAAFYMLALKYIKSLDYDKANNLIEQIPERYTDKTPLQAEILMHQEKTDEAAALLQGKLLQDFCKIQSYLFKLIDIELIADKQEQAQQIAEIAQAIVPLFGLWDYGAFIPHLQIAIYKKDVDKSIEKIKAIYEASHTLWRMSKSPLLYRIAQESFADFGNSFASAFILELENSKEYDFLRMNPEFQNLIKMFHEKIL